LEGPNGNCFVEVKNVTLAMNGTAAFPDAVSERGTKHLKELMRLKRQGHRAAIVFVIQRSDCDNFRPADEIDSEYGRWLRRAVKAGVEALPYRAKVTSREIVLTDRIATTLSPSNRLPRVSRNVRGNLSINVFNDRTKEDL
jgi:sugar fermentation stimulation protein A